MQLIFSTLLSLCSGAEKLRSILSKSCGVYLCAIVKWLFLPFCAFRASGVPNGQKDAAGTGNALLVYQRGQDISVGPVEGNCGRTVGVIPDSHPSTLGAALSFQIQTTIIPGEKMVVIHPGRHHWLESGAESHFFHPIHKPGIFRHTLSYMTTMEIRSFTYRFLRRTINGAQLFKYQRYKRNVGQLLYSFLILSSLTFAPASFFRGKYLKLRCFGEKL